MVSNSVDLVVQSGDLENRSVLLAEELASDRLIVKLRFSFCDDIELAVVNFRTFLLDQLLQSQFFEQFQVASYD